MVANCFRCLLPNPTYFSAKLVFKKCQMPRWRRDLRALHHRDLLYIIVFIYMISIVSSGRGVAMVIGALYRKSSSEYIVTMDTAIVPHTYVLRTRPPCTRRSILGTRRNIYWVTLSSAETKVSDFSQRLNLNLNS